MSVNYKIGLTRFDSVVASKRILPSRVGHDSDSSAIQTKVKDVDLATFDRFSEGYIKTLSKSLESTFRVDGVLVAAVFEGNTVVSKHGDINFKGEGGNRYEEVLHQLKAKFGERLVVEKFDSSSGLTLRHFGNGDLFTDDDISSGWQPNPTLSDNDFKKAWEKISRYKKIGSTETPGFRVRT